MDVKIIPVLDDNYAYIIQSGGVTAVIDPGESLPIIQYLKDNDLNLDWVINTHKHWDHVNGNKKLLEKYGAKLAAPAECEGAEMVLKDGEIFQCGDTKFEIILTRGHTSGHIILFDPTYRILFSGDTLFVMGCGRVFEGTMDDMYQSMQAIKKLPPETAIYCGHEYTAANIKFAKYIFPDNLSIFERAEILDGKSCTIPTTLASELMTNPFLMAETIDQFSDYRLKKDTF